MTNATALHHLPPEVRIMLERSVRAGWRPRPQGASWGLEAAAEFLVRFSCCCPTSAGHATRELPVWLQPGHLEALNRSMKMCRPSAARIITRPPRFIGSPTFLGGGRWRRWLLRI